LELGPDQIEKYLTETINISKIVFPSHIPTYINTKKNEIEELEKQIDNKHETISELNKEISDIKENRKLLIENNNISVDAIKWYKDIKEELTNMEIPFDDIPYFIQCLREIKNEGYDVNKVLTKYSELIYFEKLIDMQEETKQRNLQEIDNLKHLKKTIEEQVNWNRLKMSQIQELENIGFGLKELKTIYNIIIEIAKENEINPKEAIDKFFNDLNEYDDIVSFKKKVEGLRKEVSHLSMQIANNRITFSSQQYIGTILQELLRVGISEKDIADINSILLLGGFDYYNNNSNNIIINKQSLISELSKYRDIKSVIKSMEQKQIQLTNNITELGNQKLALENYINQLFILFSNLKEIPLLVKKANIALEYPKILLIYLSSDSNKEDNNKDIKDNNAPKKP
jgi:predicted RNase H-like nuclease (RuvC/YqgF family)